MAHGPKCLRRWKATGKARARVGRALAAARAAAKVAGAGLRPGCFTVVVERRPQWGLEGWPHRPGVIRVEVLAPLYGASAGDYSPANGALVASGIEQDAAWWPR